MNGAGEPGGSVVPGFWVFGYGSLMWRPDFPFADRARATLDGYHRALCIRSTHHRGTPRRPGLVLGLDRGLSCHGIAYRLSPETVATTVAYLQERELIYGVYRAARVSITVETANGRGHVRALAYIAERRHPAYATGFSAGQQAEIVQGARGLSGNNLDYLVNTVTHLEALGIREPELARVLGLAGPVATRDRSERLVRPSVSALRIVHSRKPSITRPVGLADQRRFGHRARLANAW